MEIESQLTREDFEAFLKYFYFKKGLTATRILIVLLAGCYVGYAMGYKSVNNAFLWGSFFIGFLIAGAILYSIIFIIPYLSARSNSKRLNRSYLFDKYKFTTSEQGIYIRHNEEEQVLLWESVKSAEIVMGYVFVMLFSKKFYLISIKNFTSEADASNFLGIICNGILKVRGQAKPKDPKSIYKWGWLGLIPNFGVITGIVFIIKGIFQYKDKWLVLIGAGCILFTVGFWYAIEHSSIFDDANAQLSQRLLNNLAKDVEFYKLKNGVYPDSLEQIRKIDEMAAIYDPIARIGTFMKFNYKKTGNKYILFSSGVDKIPDTKDDIYPTVTGMDSSRFGLIRNGTGSKLQAELEAIDRSIEDCYLKENADSLVHFYDTAFTCLPEYEPPIYETGDLQKFYSDWFKTVHIDAYSKVIYQVEHIADHVLEIGNFYLSYSKKDSSKNEYAGKYMIMWKRDISGKLKIVSEAFGSGKYIKPEDIPYAAVEVKETRALKENILSPKLSPEIEEFDKDAVKAILAGDGEGRADEFTKDGIYMPHFDPMQIGMDMIRPYMTRTYRPGVIRYVKDTYREIFELDEFVFLSGHFSVRFDNGTSKGNFEGNMSNLMKRGKDGKLLMYRQLAHN